MQKIDEVIKRLDNCIAAQKMDMPAGIHLKALRGILPEIRDELKTINNKIKIENEPLFPDEVKKIHESQFKDKKEYVKIRRFCILHACGFLNAGGFKTKPYCKKEKCIYKESFVKSFMDERKIK